uniref:Dehydrogenase/reductase (SDR family) member 4 n=1 Tax=Fundulus heteroclitus TaxID=8078 RepID=A0A3Q2PXD7_FUNHE
IPFPPRIGLAAAQALGRRGAHVVVSSRRQANVDKAVALLQSQSIRVTGTTCNVGKGEDREKLVQLVINVKSAFLLTKLVVPHMEKRGGGNVIFVSSVAALGPYSVSKTALLGLTKALAPELAQSNIRVNCVAPGIIKTRFSSALWENEDIVDEFKKQLSIKRIGEPEEIGGTIAFLCSDEASYITGETITVTGGMGCRL